MTHLAHLCQIFVFLVFFGFMKVLTYFLRTPFGFFRFFWFCLLFVNVNCRCHRYRELLQRDSSVQELMWRGFLTLTVDFSKQLAMSLYTSETYQGLQMTSVHSVCGDGKSPGPYIYIYIYTLSVIKKTNVNVFVHVLFWRVVLKCFEHVLCVFEFIGRFEQHIRISRVS